MAKCRLVVLCASPHTFVFRFFVQLLSSIIGIGRYWISLFLCLTAPSCAVCVKATCTFGTLVQHGANFLGSPCCRCRGSPAVMRMLFAVHGLWPCIDGVSEFFHSAHVYICSRTWIATCWRFLPFFGIVMLGVCLFVRSLYTRTALARGSRAIVFQFLFGPPSLPPPVTVSFRRGNTHLLVSASSLYLGGGPGSLNAPINKKNNNQFYWSFAQARINPNECALTEFA